MDRANSVRVVRKVSEILDLLAERPEASAAEMAASLGEPRSTVYRLLSSLEALELVEPGGRRGTYRLGLRLLRLGSAVVARFDERQAALPVMERLHAETEETIFLCIRRGREAVCIERIDGRWVQSMALRLGGALPLHAGAAPRVLLAYEPRQVWEEYVQNGRLQEFTPSTPVRKDALFRALAAIRATGCSISDEDVVAGIAAVGAPIFDHRGEVCAAISMSGPRVKILDENRDTSVRLIVEAGGDVSRALGFTSAPVG